MVTGLGQGLSGEGRRTGRAAACLGSDTSRSYPEITALPALLSLQLQLPSPCAVFESIFGFGLFRVLATPWLPCALP